MSIHTMSQPAYILGHLGPRANHYLNWPIVARCVPTVELSHTNVLFMYVFIRLHSHTTMPVSLVLLAFGLLCYGTTIEGVVVTLEEKSNLYIPAEYSASNPVYKLGAGLAEQMAYDTRRRLLYVVGMF